MSTDRHEWTQSGLACFIDRLPSGVWRGYVAVPSNHRLYSGFQEMADSDAVVVRQPATSDDAVGVMSMGFDDLGEGMCAATMCVVDGELVRASQSTRDRVVTSWVESAFHDRQRVRDQINDLAKAFAQVPAFVANGDLPVG